MRNGCPITIISSGMTPRQPIEQPCRPSSTRIVIAICGDPVVGRALVLLLQGSLYDARFMPILSLSEPGSLEGVRLLLLTLTWELDAERREALLAALEGASSAMEIPILELTTSGERRDGEAPSGQEHKVPWPCRPEELERRIGAALCAGPEDLPRPATSEIG
jgi:hypothetical protein